MTAITASRSRDSSVELAKGQKAHTTKASNSKGDLASLQETMDKQEKMLWATIITLAKNQVIDSDKGGLDSASIMQATSTSAQFKMQKMGLEQSMKAFDMMKEAALATTSQMVGQRVSLDDGVRSFSGAPVKFNYEILGKSLPPGAVVQTQISVMTNEGKEILSKSSRGDKLGKNSFLWTGVDKNGEKVEEGTYRISVSSSYTIPGKSSNPVGLTTTTVKKGTIDEVEVDDDLNLSLIIDGQRFGMESLRGMSRDGKKDLDEAQGPVSDYMGYFGKTVEIAQNKVDFKGADVKVPFISKVAAKDVTVKINFLDDEGKLVAYSEKSAQTITEGQNNFSWNGWDVKSPDEFKKMTAKEIDTSYLPIGVYTYNVSVVIGDVETKLDNIGTYKIDSIDKSSGKVVLGSEGYKFAVRDVKKVVENAPAQASYNQLLQEGNSFVRSRAVFEDILRYNGTDDIEEFFTIPDGLVGDALGDARIIVSDNNGNIVSTITKNGIYTQHEEITPTPTKESEWNTQLSNASATRVIQYWDKKFPGADKENPTAPQKAEMQAFIANGFRARELFQFAYDALPDAAAKYEQKLKNMGLIPFTWDGKKDGVKLPAGDYKYAIQYDVTNAGNVKTETLPDSSTGIVVAAHVENGEVILGIQDEHETVRYVPISKVSKVGI